MDVQNSLCNLNPVKYIQYRHGCVRCVAERYRAGRRAHSRLHRCFGGYACRTGNLAGGDGLRAAFGALAAVCAHWIYDEGDGNYHFRFGVWQDAGNLSSITNQNGEFRLRLPDSLRQGRIVVSHVGYVGQEMDMSLLEAQHAVWSLEPRVIPIQEVVIRAVNPIRLLREMLKAKKTNYASVPIYLTTFYREGVRYKQKFRNLTEAVFKIYKPSPLLNHFQDHVKLLKMSRIVNSQERDTLIAKISAGIDACLQLDIVKNLPDFLLPDDKGNVYSYASCDMTVIDNRLVNVISFRQNKGIKEPLYCGELYIDAENNALVQARLEINPAYVRQATDMFIERKTRKWKITAQEVVYTISYRQWNGIYYMNHIRGDLYFKVKLKRQWFSSSSLHTWFEMVTCKVDTDNVTRFQRKERMPTRTIFSDTHFKYDADFWGEFNVIPWEEELGTVIEKLSSKIEQIEY